MKFPNWFKIIWWLLLLAALTLFLYSRLPSLAAGGAVSADIVIFLVWIGLALAPIFPEIELFGLRLKQEIDQIKREVASLKISQNQKMVFNFASPQDMQRKFAEEESEALEPQGQILRDTKSEFLLRMKQPGTVREQIRGFHSLALQAVRAGKSPIEFDTLNEELRLDDSTSRYVVDAVASSATTHFLIEVRFIQRPSALLNTALQLLKLTQRYFSYVSQQSFQVDVIPVLILPAGLNIPLDQLESIPFLIYDPTEDLFVNADDFPKRVDRWLSTLQH